MDKFFAHFSSLLKDKNNFQILSLRLAKGASLERVLEHYRYQFRSKVSESICETFIVLREKIADRWDFLLEKYLHDTLESPRSLNFVPIHFFEWLKAGELLTTIDLELAELELEIDIFPWSHKFEGSISFEDLNEESILELNPYKILNFSNDVYELYHQRNSEGATQLILWLNSEGVFIRKVSEWQVRILQRLSRGIGNALEGLEDLPPEEIQSFFEWLAASQLVKSQK